MSLILVLIINIIITKFIENQCQIIGLRFQEKIWYKTFTFPWVPE